MRLMVLALASFLLVSCGQGGEQGDDAGRQRDPRPETVQWTDGKGDMWAAKFADEDDTVTRPDSPFIPHTPRPTSTNGDIRHVAVSHGPESLVIKAKYVDLNEVEAMTPIRALVETSIGIQGDISISWHGASREALAIIVIGNGSAECNAASATVDFEANTATVRVPRSCLGLPRWVRVYLESEIPQSKNYQAEPVHMDSAMAADFPAATTQDGTLLERVLSKRVYANTPSSPSGRGETTLQLLDPRGDVVSIRGEMEDFSEGSPAPQQKDGDILSTKVEHTATQLRIRVEFAHIVRDSKLANYRLGAVLKPTRASGGSTMTREVRQRSHARFSTWERCRSVATSTVQPTTPTARPH